MCSCSVVTFFYILIKSDQLNIHNNPVNGVIQGGLRVASRKFPESLVTSGELSSNRLCEGGVGVYKRLFVIIVIR